MVNPELHAKTTCDPVKMEEGAATMVPLPGAATMQTLVHMGGPLLHCPLARHVVVAVPSSVVPGMHEYTAEAPMVLDGGCSTLPLMGAVKMAQSE